ncbi:hypothetical protein ES703_124829 [subsurface metagenome]
MRVYKYPAILLCLCLVFILLMGCVSQSNKESTDAIVYSDRGRAHAIKDDLDRAIADFNKAIELDPRYAEVYRHRGLVYAEKGDYKAAIADGEQFLKLAPNHPLVPQMRQQLMEEWKKKAYATKSELDYAIEEYTQAIELNPKDANAPQTTC